MISSVSPSWLGCSTIYAHRIYNFAGERSAVAEDRRARDGQRIKRFQSCTSVQSHDLGPPSRRKAAYKGGGGQGKGRRIENKMAFLRLQALADHITTQQTGVGREGHDHHCCNSIGVIWCVQRIGVGIAHSTCGTGLETADC